MEKIFNITNFKTGKHYAIEASAGTGKTYSIIQIVRKLLLGENNKGGVGLDKILIVTYTEKAAGELKDRIRKMLNDSKQGINGVTIKTYLDHKVNIDVDNASIGTIHSFCKNTIKEFVISSRQATNLGLSNKLSTQNFAKRYIRTSEILTEINKLLSLYCKIDEDKLVNYLVAANDRYYLDEKNEENVNIVSFVNEDNIVNKTNLQYALFNSSDVGLTLQDNDENLYNHYHTLNQSTDKNIIEFIELFKDYKKFLVDERTKWAEFGINLTSKPYKEPNIKAALKALWGLKEIEGVKYLVTRYLKDFYKAYRVYQEENRLQSFNDMLRVVREKVYEDNSELLKCLRNKYTYGIIDEFQDTNQIQFDIFKKVFLEKDKGTDDEKDNYLIVVGDPKQSIYSFQGADVTVYEKAVKEIGDRDNGEKCRLVKNYRSYIGVVEFGNKLFQYYPFSGEFTPSEYCLKTNIDKDGKHENERRLMFKGEYSSGLWLNETPLSKEEYAKFAVEQILKCVSLNKVKNDKGEEETVTDLRKIKFDDNGSPECSNVDFSDFVVLARKSSEMKYIQLALKNANIPSVKYKDNSLFKGFECPHWIALLEAVDVEDFTGSNRGYFKKALKTKFFNKSLAEISKKIYDTDGVVEVKLFDKWRQLACERLWQNLFDEIMIDSGLDKHMSSVSDSHSLGIFKQIAKFSIDYLSEGNTLSDLINYLKDIYNSGLDDEEGGSIVDKSTDFNCVRIMTMHASKGLQFSVVISVSGCGGENKNGEVYSYHIEDDHANTRAVISLTKNEKVKTEEKAELFRLYYVAYTRPEYLLIAPRYMRVLTKGNKVDTIKSDDKAVEISSKMEMFIEQYKGKSFVVDGVNVPYYQLQSFDNIKYEQLKEDTNTVLNKGKKVNEAEINDTLCKLENQIEKRKIELKFLTRKKAHKGAYRHSYSTLSKHGKEEKTEFINDLFEENKNDETEQITLYDTSAKIILGKYDDQVETIEIPKDYPKGNKIGNVLHAIFENIDFRDYNKNKDIIIENAFKKSGMKNVGVSYTENLIHNTINAELPEIKGNDKGDGYFKLEYISWSDRLPEVSFDYDSGVNGKFKNLLTGAIDLVFRRGEVYSILDWKSDTLNENFISYSDPEQLKNRVDSHYSIQRVIYSYSLIKWLTQYYKLKNVEKELTEADIFKEHFGGIYYIFVRGCNEGTSNGIYCQTWESWEDLEKEFNKIKMECMGGK